MDKYAQKDKKNMCNNCKETNQPENPTAINAAVELKEASDAVKRIHSAISDKGLTYYIETYGCQMNEHDSENIAGMLVQCGYTKADCKETADFILFNTCCVREHAELRTFGNVGFVKELKQKNPHLILGVCGCMMQQKQVAKNCLIVSRLLTWCSEHTSSRIFRCCWNRYLTTGVSSVLTIQQAKS